MAVGRECECAPRGQISTIIVIIARKYGHTVPRSVYRAAPARIVLTRPVAVIQNHSREYVIIILISYHARIVFPSQLHILEVDGIDLSNGIGGKIRQRDTLAVVFASLGRDARNGKILISRRGGDTHRRARKIARSDNGIERRRALRLQRHARVGAYEYRRQRRALDLAERVGTLAHRNLSLSKV